MKGREIGKDDVNTSINSGDAVERSDRPAVDGSTGRWTDVLNNRPVRILYLYLGFSTQII